MATLTIHAFTNLMVSLHAVVILLIHYQHSKRVRAMHAVQYKQ